MHLASSTNFDAETFKQVDALLHQFSKTHTAWSVTMQVLTMPGLTEMVSHIPCPHFHFSIRSTSMQLVSLRTR